MFLDYAQRCSTVGRAPLDEWSARRRDLYLTTHDTHNRQISMLPVGFEPTISAGERPCRWWAPNNASKYQMGFNSGFKGLSYLWTQFTFIHILITPNSPNKTLNIPKIVVILNCRNICLQKLRIFSLNSTIVLPSKFHHIRCQGLRYRSTLFLTSVLEEVGG